MLRLHCRSHGLRLTGRHELFDARNERIAAEIQLRLQILPWACAETCTIRDELPIQFSRIRSVPWVERIEDRVGIQPCRLRAQPRCRAVAAPRPIFRSRDHTRTHRVEDDVAGQLEEIRFFSRPDARDIVPATGVRPAHVSD